MKMLPLKWHCEPVTRGRGVRLVCRRPDGVNSSRYYGVAELTELNHSRLCLIVAHDVACLEAEVMGIGK